MTFAALFSRLFPVRRKASPEEVSPTQGGIVGDPLKCWICQRTFESIPSRMQHDLESHPGKFPNLKMSVFESIKAQHPDEKDAFARLENLMGSSARGRNQHAMSDLIDALKPQDRDRFVIVLGQLTRAGVLRLTFALTSPLTGKRWGEFDSLEDVPNEFTDAGHTFDVMAEHLEPIYTL